MEGHRRFPSSFAYLVQFKGPRDYGGYRAVFTASKITRFCTSYGKLRAAKLISFTMNVMSP